MRLQYKGLVALLLTLSTGVNAQTLDVFYTDEAIAIAGADYTEKPTGWTVRYHPLIPREVVMADAKRQMNAQLGDLKNEAQAQEAFANWRQSQQARDTLKRLQRGVTSLSLMSSHHIERLPAIVINDTHVAYGVSTLQAAVEAFRGAGQHGSGSQ